MGQKYAVPVAKFVHPSGATAVAAPPHMTPPPAPRTTPPPPPSAARPIPVRSSGTGVNTADVDEPDGLWEQLNLNMLPSWLTSMVFHMSCLLMLALIATGGTGNGGPGHTVYYDATIGGDGSEGDGEALLKGDDPLAQMQQQMQQQLQQTVSSDQPQLPQAEVPPLTDFTNALAVAAPPMDVIGSLKGFNDGKGTGTGGHGNGSGGGDGDEVGRGSDGLGGLGPKKIGLFEIASEGSSFVYVFDRSGSMNSVLQYTSPEGDSKLSVSPLIAAKAELVRSLRELTPKQHFHLLFYNHQVTPFNTGRSLNKTIPATSENLRRVESFVQSVQAFGKTYHIEPMEMALKMKPDVIFLLTDGEEQDDPSEGQLEYLNKLNAGYRTKINVIQIGFEPRPGCTLERLAKDNRGKHRFLNIADLLPAMDKMVK